MPNIRVKIPFPYEQFTDMEFVVTDLVGKLIPNNTYVREDDTHIKFMSTDASNLGIKNGDELRFTFVHNRGCYHVNKVEYHLIAQANSREYNVDASPFTELLDLDVRFKVFYDRTLVYQHDTTTYLFDSKNGILRFDEDFKLETGKRIDIVCFYVGNKQNFAIPCISMSGYIYLKKNEIDRNYNKNLMAVFMNGKLVDRDILIDMSNNIHKISADIGSRYNLEVKNMSPRIDSLIPFYKKMAHVSDIPKQYTYKEFPLIFTVPKPNTPHNRKFIDPTLLNPITFYGLLPPADHYLHYITLLHHGTNEGEFKERNITYTVKFFRDDYAIEPEDVNVIGQIRYAGNSEEFIYNSPTALLMGKIPSTIGSNKTDYPILSVQVKSIYEADTTNHYTDMDGIMCRMEIDPPTYYNYSKVYYEMTSTEYEKDNYVNVFEWVISEKANGEGQVYYRKTINLFPDNNPYENR